MESDDCKFIPRHLLPFFCFADAFKALKLPLEFCLALRMLDLTLQARARKSAVAGVAYLTV